MKKFKFRLQKVMEFKEDIEKQRQQDLAEAKQAHMLELDKLNLLFQEDHECRKSLQEENTQEIINPAVMDCYYRYLKKLKTDIDHQNGNVEESNEEVERRRQTLIEASRERKILEKLKEKKFLDYRINLDKKEQHILDEVASNQYIRKGRDPQ